MIQKIGGIGIAIENNCAIEFIDGRFYKVIISYSEAPPCGNQTDPLNSAPRLTPSRSLRRINVSVVGRFLFRGHPASYGESFLRA
jgi:hypothetical protein